MGSCKSEIVGVFFFLLLLLVVVFFLSLLLRSSVPPLSRRSFLVFKADGLNGCCEVVVLPVCRDG